MVVTKGHTYLNKPVALSFAPLYLLGIAHQGCFCALVRGTCRSPATSKMKLFVTLLNGFQSLTNVTKNCSSPTSVSIVAYKNIVPKY